MATRNEEQVAEAISKAYYEQGPNPWKTAEGKDVPRKWEGLTEEERGKWFAAARAAIDAVTK